jgi:hypothetical protein
LEADKLSYSLSLRSIAALAAALGLATALVAPTFASAGTLRSSGGTHFAQDDPGDADSPGPTTDDQSTAPPSVAAASLDPCQVVTSAEASALAGTTFGAGREDTTDGGSRVCVYGYQTLNVFIVVVAQAPDAATAQAAWADEQARVQDLMQRNVPPGVRVNLNLDEAAGIQGYDNSATASASGSVGARTLNVSAIYLLKGPTFVSYSDLLADQAAPTTDALAGEAQTVLGRLP